VNLRGKTVVVTGAAGGMGELIAGALAERGCSLILSDLNESGLKQLQEKVSGHPTIVAADLCTADGLNKLAEACRMQGSVDVLVNAAGISDFGMFEDMPAARIGLALDVNLRAPMQLTQALLPLLKSAPEAAIINIGSTFGAIGYPGFSAYCASKAGLRGFTEALRRELADTAIDVCYLAPRATRTNMNANSVVAMNEKLGNAMDPPQVVVDQLLVLLEGGKSGDFFLGWPEKLFVRVNGLLPSIVDAALGKQLQDIKVFADKSVRG